MSRVLLVVCAALLSLGFVNSQPKPYRVAFDLTSRDSLDQQAVVRWIKEVTAGSPEAEIEVVMYGKGIELGYPSDQPSAPPSKPR